MTTESSRKTSPLLVAAAWTVVALPMAWGVYETVIKSVPLFRSTAATSSPLLSRDQSAKSPLDSPRKG